MGVYSNELAPNLYKSYFDWFINYMNKVGSEPDKKDKTEAYKYFYGSVVVSPEYDFSEDELVYIWKDGKESSIVGVHEEFLDVYVENGWEPYD